jgi:hypothetical protein
MSTLSRRGCHHVTHMFRLAEQASRSIGLQDECRKMNAAK